MKSVLLYTCKVRKSKQSILYLIYLAKYIVSDFRTKINRKFGKEVTKMYEKYLELRESKGITDYKVSEDTGITKSTFSDWKSGRSEPKIAKLAILAKYFNVSVDYFVN